MLTQPQVIISLSHRDKILMEKFAWFLKQPGVTWLEHPRPGDNAKLPRLNINRKGVFLETGVEEFHFHPSMSLLRIINIVRGESDRFLHATGLRPGDYFVDATLGLGSDSLIAAWAVGETGKVTAIERTGVLAALVQDGLLDLASGQFPYTNNSGKERAWILLAEAAARISVQWGEHLEVLQGMLTQSVDSVYFDPMFRHTREQSASIRPLHQWAEMEALSFNAVQEACRVARKKVVLKERKGSSEFTRLGFDVFPGGTYSKVDYGVIDLL
ncbi:MAG: class I SAM-dependent methyltransferase [Desulfitobacteriaceae bacterium]